jgi:short-subunit dehydrogenase
MVLGTVSSSYFANNPGSEDKLPKVAKMVPVVTPEEVAEAMCKAVERKRGTVIMPLQMKFVAISSQHFLRMNHFMLWLTGARRSARKRAEVAS